MLERRARSRAELAEALRSRDVPDDAANRVLDRFAEVKLIDDAALAESLVGAQHRDRGLARRAITAKLRQRGLTDEDIVTEALSKLDAAAERRRGVELVRRRQRSLSSLPVPVQTRRLVGLLARKGYPGTMAYEVVRDVLREVAGEDDQFDDDM